MNDSPLLITTLQCFNVVGKTHSLFSNLGIASRILFIISVSFVPAVGYFPKLKQQKLPTEI